MAKAAQEGVSVRTVILRFLQQWVDPSQESRLRERVDRFLVTLARETESLKDGSGT